MRSAEQFKEAILDVLEEGRWTVPTLLETYNANHMTREGARVYALEHCVFAANFPRWLTNIAGNCPVLEVRQYLIQNAFVEEVRDPTIVTGHYESLVDFAVALGLDRDYIYNYQGAPVTKIRIWKGTESNLEVGFRQDVFLTIPKGKIAQLKITVETHQPILAPISGGQQLGTLKLTLAGKPYAEFPLLALNSVPLANVFSRGWDSIRLIFE